MKKPLVFVVSIVGIIFLLKYLVPELEVLDSLASIKSYHDRWLVIYQQAPLKILLFFFLFNMMMAALPVPGISMISFIGGMLFGFTTGALLSSIATALGNLIGFFIARYFLQEWILKRYGENARIFKEEWQNEGTMALLSFRLFPFIPSFVANLIMGVSNLHWWTFFWASWVGRIPMVVVYTWAGVQFAKIEGLEDILSPKVALAFIILALLPWGFKLIKSYRDKK
nr:VTT domain-containing protein [Bacteriovorax sp. HI3]